MSKNVSVRIVEQRQEYGNPDLESDLVAVPVSLQERCKKYYRDSYKFYETYFLKCLEEIEELQPSGFACIQVSRYFTVGVLPKYCIIPDPLTRKERDRVERIMGS